MQSTALSTPQTAMELAHYLHSLLPSTLKDYCPNGLQIEGTRSIRKIVTGVTATLELLEAAQAWDADTIFVHHGLFWSGDSPCLVGWRRKRIEAFLQSGVSLYAYHLPLDIHPELGNNAQLAQQLDIRVHEAKAEQGLLWFGQFDEPLLEKDFSEFLALRLGHTPLVIETGRTIQNVAWCTGGAQRYFENALEAAPFPLDAYITGEISEQYVHLSRMTGVTFAAAGHHATERYGVQAVGVHLENQFAIEHRFIDCPSPV